jgi:hypothetical protein
MKTTASTSSKLAIFATLLTCWCTPLRDLDRAASGRGGSSGGATGVGSGGSDGSGMGQGGLGGTDNLDAAAPTGGAVATGGKTHTGGAVPSGGVAGTGGIERTGGVVGSGGAAPTGGTVATGGAIGTGGIVAMGGSYAGGGATGMGGAGGTAGTIAPDLPSIFDSPVQGDITYSSGASWDIDGEMWPAFEIHTPTASYWLVKSAAAIVSINDTSGLQWINFASGFRPNRGVPNLGGCCQPGNPTKLGLPPMTTVIDPAFTITTTHLRLISTADDGTYWLVWDFFQTHFTLTINRAGKAFGFTYRGVPGGAIDAADQLVLSSGTMQSASTSYRGDLPGPSEWVYLSHPAAKQSLFLIQHSDDALAETYQIVDGDTAMVVFGDGKILQTPIRFSLGLVNSSDDQVIRNRITFVHNAIH